MNPRTIFWIRRWLIQNPDRAIRISYNRQAPEGAARWLVQGEAQSMTLMYSRGGSFIEAVARFSRAANTDYRVERMMNVDAMQLIEE